MRRLQFSLKACPHESVMVWRVDRHQRGSVRGLGQSGPTCDPPLEYRTRQVALKAKAEEQLNKYGLTPMPRWRDELAAHKASETAIGYHIVRERKMVFQRWIGQGQISHTCRRLIR